MKNTLLTTGFSTLALLTLPSQGVFTLLDNFESYTAGTSADGVGGWTANGDTTFAADGSGVVLTSAETALVTTTNVYKTMPTIAGGTTGTMFFRARASNPADFVIGSSDVANPGNWPDFEGYLRFAGGNIDVRGDTVPGNVGGFVNVGTYTPAEWYNVWLVLDHAADTTTVYVNQGNADATTPAGSGTFRTAGNTVHGDLINMFIRNNDPTNSGSIDDIYIDTTGANLTNPAAIPEPATSLLALVGLAFGMRRRRS